MPKVTAALYTERMRRGRVSAFLGIYGALVNAGCVDWARVSDDASVDSQVAADQGVAVDAPDAGATTQDVTRTDAPTPDVTTTDTGSSDVGAPPDLPPVDAGATDSGPRDVAPTDHGATDLGAPDGGAIDAGQPDTGALDAGFLDAGVLDTGPLDTGPVDTGAHDAGTVGVDVVLSCPVTLSSNVTCRGATACCYALSVPMGCGCVHGSLCLATATACP